MGGKFKSCRMQCKTVLNHDRQAHRYSSEPDLVSNLKKLWRYIKSCSESHIESNVVLNCHASDSKSVLDLFAYHVGSFYKDSMQCFSPAFFRLDVFEVGDMLT